MRYIAASSEVSTVESTAIRAGQRIQGSDDLVRVPVGIVHAVEDRGEAVFTSKPDLTLCGLEAYNLLRFPEIEFSAGGFYDACGECVGNLP